MSMPIMIIYHENFVKPLYFYGKVAAMLNKKRRAIILGDEGRNKKKDPKTGYR